MSDHLCVNSNFPLTSPKGWAFCDGFDAVPKTHLVFSLALFMAVTEVHFAFRPSGSAYAAGAGPGSFVRDLGETSVSSITLLVSEIPVHTHQMRFHEVDLAELNAPANNRVLANSANTNAYQSVTNANLVTMAPQALPPAGGGLPHNNMQPYLTLNFCIALQGIFPQRP